MKHQNRLMSFFQLTAFTFNHRVSVSTMLILNAVCLATVGAFEGYANVPLSDELSPENQVEEQQVKEQQVKELSAIAYPNPFLNDFTSDVLEPEPISPEIPAIEESEAFIPLSETILVSEPLPEQMAKAENSAMGTSLDLVAQSVSTEALPEFGQRGQKRWYIQGGVGADFDDDLLGLVGGGFSYFVFDKHSINLELNGLAVGQQGDDAVGLNLNLLARSHWIRRENWSIYIDGGAGLLFTTNDVPAAGSSFNFTPQIGGGATFAITDTQRLMTGLRWYHISNAGTSEPNPGLDALYGYVGYSFPF